MRKDNYAYFLSTNGTPKDDESRSSAAKSELYKFKDLKIGKAKEVKKGNFHHRALSIEMESESNLSETLDNIHQSIYSRRDLAEKLKLISIKILKTSQISYINWQEILSVLKDVFAYSSTKIITCNGIIQYANKKQRQSLSEEAHSLALDGHKGVTKVYNRIR